MCIHLCTQKIRLRQYDSYCICTPKEIISRKEDKAFNQISNGLSTDQTGFLKNRMRVLVYKYWQANNNVYND